MLRANPKLRPKNLRNIWPNRRQSKSFSPPRVTQDLVRLPSLIRQVIGQLGDDCGPLLAVVPKLGAQRHIRKLLRLVVAQNPAFEGHRTFVTAYSYELMTSPFQVWGQLTKLAWKILMNQQQSHLTP